MPALIAWRNLADLATPVLTDTTALPEHPVAHLKKRGLAAELITQPSQRATLTIDLDQSLIPREFDDSLDARFLASVHCLLALPDGSLIVGGQFDGRLAKCSDNGIDGAFNARLDAPPRALAALPDGGFLIAGDFSTVNGKPCAKLAWLNPDGSLRATRPPAINGSINAVAVADDGDIIIAGRFTASGTTPYGHSFTCTNTARLKSNGTLQIGWYGEPNGQVRALAALPEGGFLIAGDFTTVDNKPASRIARLERNGAPDAGFKANVDRSIESMAVQPDGKILIGGMVRVDGKWFSGLARLNPDGTLDQTARPPIVGAAPAAMAVQPDGKILIGGSFEAWLDSRWYRYLMRLKPDASLDLDFEVAPNAPVRAIAMTEGGTAWVGGDFTRMDGSNALRLARFNVSTPPPAVRAIALLGLGTSEGVIDLDYRRNGTSVWRPLAQWKLNAETSSLIHTMPEGLSARATLRLRYSSANNRSLRVGRLWISDALTLPDGVDAGWSMSFRDTGTLDPTSGGQWVPSPGVRSRVLTIPLEAACSGVYAWGFDDEARAITQPQNLHALQLQAGTTGEVIAIARTRTPLWARQSAVYGHIDQPFAITHKAGPYWGSTLSIVEEC